VRAAQPDGRGRAGVVRARGLGVRYLTRRMPALSAISFTLGAGERVLIAGPSGGGKSTLALCLAGLIPRSVDADMSGEVAVADAAAPETTPPVGVVFQDPGSQFTMLTVEDEVAFGLENLGVPEGEMPRRVREALAWVGLDDRAGWRVDRLSGGQQQRVALAAVLTLRPRVLVLDEPAAHLDPQGAEDLYTQVTSLAAREDLTLVVVEHDLDKVVPGVLDRGLIIGETGGLVADGALSRLLGNAAGAAQWEAAGLWLPTPPRLALALGAGSDDVLPLDEQAAGRWIAARPRAQEQLRAAASSGSLGRGGQVILEARGLRQRYRSAAGAHQGLRGVDVRVHEGEIIAVVGANGSGKSTLLRALSALVPLQQGSVTIDGIDLYRADARTAAGLVAHVFQNPEAGFVARTVVGEIGYGPRLLGWDEATIARHVERLLARFGLTSLAGANPYTLSQGQKRRLSVAVALVAVPRVLLLDEPTFGQDRRTATALIDDISALRDDGLGIVVATHDVGLVVDVADRVVALAEGRVLFDGPARAFITDSGLVARTGQVRPALARVLSAAQGYGAAVPDIVRWRDLDRVNVGRRA